MTVIEQDGMIVNVVDVVNTAYTSGGGGSTDCNDGFNSVEKDGVDISSITQVLLLKRRR